MIKKITLILFIVSYGFVWYRLFFYEDVLVKLEKDKQQLASAAIYMKDAYGC